MRSEITTLSYAEDVESQGELGASPLTVVKLSVWWKVSMLSAELISCCLYDWEVRLLAGHQLEAVVKSQRPLTEVPVVHSSAVPCHTVDEGVGLLTVTKHLRSSTYQERRFICGQQFQRPGYRVDWLSCFWASSKAVRQGHVTQEVAYFLAAEKQNNGEAPTAFQKQPFSL